MSFEPFHIDTKGFCLLCLNECQSLSDGSSDPDNNNSLKMFLRYLNVNIYDMYNFSPSFLQSIGATESASQVETSLCSQCSDTAKHFAKLYFDMEIIRVKLDKLVQSLFDAMRKGTSKPRLVQEFRRRLKATKTVMGMVNANAAEKLRDEAMQKCSVKVDGLADRAALLQRDFALFRNHFSEPVHESLSDSSTKDIRHSSFRHKPSPSSNNNKNLTMAVEDENEEEEFASVVVKSEPTTTLEMNATNFTFPDLSGDQFNGINIDGSDPLSEEGHRGMNSSSMDDLIFNPEISMEEGTERPHQSTKGASSYLNSPSRRISIAAGVRRRGRKPGSFPETSYVPRRNIHGLFECPTCKKSFKSSSHCRRHFETIHLNLKKYKCNACELAFKRVEQLKFHFVSMHQGLMYQCPYCTRTSPHVKIIKTHMLSQHPEQHEREQAEVISTTAATRKSQQRFQSQAQHDIETSEAQEEDEDFLI